VRRIILHNYFPARRTQDASSAEIARTKAWVQSMGLKDLEWRISSAERLGITDPALLKIYRDELERKKSSGGGGKDDWSPEARKAAAESRKKGKAARGGQTKAQAQAKTNETFKRRQANKMALIARTGTPA
jgi:hypothetical protein